MLFLLGPVSGALVAGGVSRSSKHTECATHAGAILGLLWLLYYDPGQVSDLCLRIVLVIDDKLTCFVIIEH